MKSLRSDIKNLDNPTFYAAKTNATIDGPSDAYLTFNLVQVNIGGCYEASTGTFTAPEDGNYFFESAVQKRGSSGNLQLYWYVNKANIGRGIYCDVAGDSPHPVMSIMLPLKAGTSVNVYYNVSSGSNIYASGEWFTYFTGWRV